MNKAKIAVLVSGGGTNLQALLDAEQNGILRSGEIVLVVSNNPRAYALQRAEKAGVETAILTGKDFEEALSQHLKEREIDLIILAGFMRILSASFTSAWPNRILNVHPSLIPAFCGKGFYGLRVHEEALARGVKVTGATVHFVNEIPDGGEIILPKAVDVLQGDTPAGAPPSPQTAPDASPGDTPEILQKRVMEQAEWILLPQAAELVSKGVTK